MNGTPSLKFAQSYAPKKPQAAYAWVLAYSQEKLALYERVTDTLDRKAESFMRYTGGIGVALAAALPIVLREDAALVIVFIPSLLALFFAAMRSGQSIVPSDYAALPDIQQAFQYVDYFGEDAQARFYAQAVPAERILQQSISTKATFATQAFRHLRIALGWLAVSVSLVGFSFLWVLPRGLSVLWSVWWSVAGCLAVLLLAAFEWRSQKKIQATGSP